MSSMQHCQECWEVGVKKPRKHSGRHCKQTPTHVRVPKSKLRARKSSGHKTTDDHDTLPDTSSVDRNKRHKKAAPWTERTFPPISEVIQQAKDDRQEFLERRREAIKKSLDEIEAMGQKIKEGYDIATRLLDKIKNGTWDTADDTCALEAFGEVD